MTDQKGLTGSGPIEIWVRWVMQPPYFDAGSRTPGSATFALSMLQHTAPGTLISSVPLLGFTKDPWQVPFLRYTWAPATPAAAAALFVVDQLTANVSLALSELA